jgi:ariadne-1
MRYCPAAKCDKVAIASGITTVRCDCGNPFCFKCGEESHDPASCTQLGEWSLKCQNESETANWILANTKKCPACSARIEKNQGCNHVTCKMCKHDFCWICMGNWNDHGQSTGGYYKCNRFESGKIPSDSDNEQQKAKAELDRYLHYYQRYHGHDSSLKFAAGQRDVADKKMLERQESQKFPWTDVQFLKQAAEQVIECRRILKYTYVLGFFLVDGTPIKQLFEHHQEMLEKNTEMLHEYTEKSIELIDRTQVVNLTRVNEKFLAALLASMMNGSIIDESLDSNFGLNDMNNNDIETNNENEEKQIEIKEKAVKTKSKSKKESSTDESSARQTRSTKSKK